MEERRLSNSGRSEEGEDTLEEGGHKDMTQKLDPNYLRVHL